MLGLIVPFTNSSNMMTGNILQIYQNPTGKTDAIAMQHDVGYTVCGNDKSCKRKADIKKGEITRCHSMARETMGTCCNKKHYCR